MRISESWLCRRAGVKRAPDIAERLTMLGLEVGQSTPAAAFDGVVAGLIRSCEPHPQQAGLQICSVDAGGGKALSIVCGAPNARPGLCAPLALDGATLPTAKGPRTIRAASLHGHRSAGMLCSAAELGIGDDGDNLLDLGRAAPGSDLRKLLGLDDRLLHLDLTPNRGDCLSLRGLARELALSEGKKLRKMRRPKVPQGSDAALQVRVDDAAACPVYMGRIVEGLDNSRPTPQHITTRLRQADIQAHSLAVDITNYVMLELGQPMHGFDAALLRGGVRVRRARRGEQLAALNGQQLELGEEDLVIAQLDGPAIALAGIIGGAATATAKTSSRIFLESAFFSPRALAGRARHHRLQTESSHRYERGVDPLLQERALERAAELILKYGGGRAGPICRAQSKTPRESAIAVPHDYLEAMSGQTLRRQWLRRLWRNLGVDAECRNGVWQLRPPSWRFDLRLAADFSEEVARVLGYDRLATRPPQFTPQSIALPRAAGRPLHRLLAARGYHEAIAYSLVPAASCDWFGGGEALHLHNPMASDMAVMRTSLLAGLLPALARNRNRQRERVRLFAIGNCFFRSGDGCAQSARLAALACGPRWPRAWGHGDEPVDFHDIKGDLQSLAPAAMRFARAQSRGFHPGQCAALMRGDECLGSVGALHPRLLAQLDISCPVFAFEVQLRAFERGPVAMYERLSRHPAVQRDLALIVPQRMESAALLECVERLRPPILKELDIFDVYSGPGVPPGHKSMALALTFRADSRTLRDAEVDDALRELVLTLRRDYNIRHRRQSADE